MSKRKPTHKRKSTATLSGTSSRMDPSVAENASSVHGKEGDPLSSEPIVPKPARTPRSRWLLLVTLLFLFWGLFFILTDIYISQIRGFGERSLTLYHIFRDHLYRADMSTYTFASEMGMSLYSAILTGFGGIADPLLSLLPERIHPQILNLISALRLSLSGVAMAAFLMQVRKIFSKPAGKPSAVNATSSFPFSAPFLLCGIFGTLYSGLALLFCILLPLPVADTFFWLPLLLRAICCPKVSQDPSPRFRLHIPLLWAAFLCANAAWGLFLLPLPLFFLILTGRRSSSHHAVSHLISFVLAVGLGAGLLFPQYAKLPVLSKKERSSAAFLQRLGSDTDLQHDNVTFRCEATDMLLRTIPAMYITTLPVEPDDPSQRSAPVYATHFEYLNEWVYSLWPALPVQPFQDMGQVEGQQTAPNSVTFSTSTLFMDTMYCAVTLPQRQHPAKVYLNDHLLTTISHNSGTVLLELGAFQVGQAVNVRIVTEEPEEVFRASCSFGYLNSINWNIYTGSATYGIFNMKTSTDGITADAQVYGDAVLLTNIPYESGWTMYLDGKTVPLRAYEDAWICATVPAGNYIVHLHYTAPGSVLGGVISGISFLILAGICISYGKKKTSADPS